MYWEVNKSVSGWVEGRQEPRGGGWSDLICTTSSPALLPHSCLAGQPPVWNSQFLSQFWPWESWGTGKSRDSRNSRDSRDSRDSRPQYCNRCEPPPSWPSPGKIRADDHCLSVEQGRTRDQDQTMAMPPAMHRPIVRQRLALVVLQWRRVCSL